MKKKNRCDARSFYTNKRCEKRIGHPGELDALTHRRNDEVWVTTKPITTWTGAREAVLRDGEIQVTTKPITREAVLKASIPPGLLKPFQLDFPKPFTLAGMNPYPGRSAGDEICECALCAVKPTVTASPEQQLSEWWMQAAEDEIARTVPKAIEYSATDLADIGKDLARAMGREVSDEEAAELGVFFYLRGKMSRWVGSVIAGQRISDDTLFDIGVYVRMAQRIRAVGSWPGVDLEEK